MIRKPATPQEEHRALPPETAAHESAIPGPRQGAHAPEESVSAEVGGERGEQVTSERVTSEHVIPEDVIPEDDAHEEFTGAKRVDLQLWRRLFRFVLCYPRQLTLLIVGGMATAIADASLPMVTKELIDDIARSQEVGGAAVSITPYLVVFGALSLLLITGIFTFIYNAGRIRTSVSHDIRQEAFENLQRLSFAFFDHRPVGWLMARMTSDCERLSNVFAWGILDLFWASTIMLGVAVFMFVCHWPLALMVLSTVPVIAWVSLRFQRRILDSARIVRKTNSRITAAYNEGIMGIRTSKIFDLEDRSADAFERLTDQMLGASVRNATLAALFSPVVMTIASIATGAAVVYGGWSVAAAGISVGTLIAFVQYTRLFFDPIQELSHWFAEMQMAQASAERILLLIESQPEIQDSPQVQARIAAFFERTGAAASEEVAAEQLALDGYPDEIGEIEFRQVSFSYESGVPVLSNIDLRVRAGETVALVGATGGGKSTLLNLLCRFYEPTAGAILIDRVDLRDRSLAWLQSNLGIVLQEPHLFSGTIAENIRYGFLEATAEQIRHAAEVSGAAQFIDRLPRGYETEVGEGGNRLSTGEKQLISFARAIVGEPRILIMDEATSSVDTETERRIQQGLDRVLEGRTCFVIAHRLSTIRRAHQILVIEGGRIAECGTHAELLALRGKYFGLYMHQGLRESTLEPGLE